MPPAGTGSGVVVSTDGLILTALHVVNHAREVYVRFPDRLEKRAKIVGFDRFIDIAVLRLVELPPKLFWLELGNSDNLRVGQRVIAVGNPGNLSTTFTSGIISYLGRSGLGLWPVEAYIQTDAQINPGNSGGPLVSSEGRVIGINDAGHSKYPGLGFAVPVALASNAMAAILVRAEPAYPWLGCYVMETGRELDEEIQVAGPRSEGLFVLAVAKDSPAQAAGIRFGDCLSAFDGAALRSCNDLASLVAGKKIGDKATLAVLRDTARFEKDVIRARRPLKPLFDLDDFTRLFLRCEFRCETNEGDGVPLTNRFVWSIGRNLEASTRKATATLTNQAVLYGIGPGEAFAAPERPLEREHVEYLLNRCFVEDARKVALSIKLLALVPVEYPPGYGFDGQTRMLLRQTWRPFEIGANQRGY